MVFGLPSVFFVQRVPLIQICGCPITAASTLILVLCGYPYTRFLLISTYPFYADIHAYTSSMRLPVYPLHAVTRIRAPCGYPYTRLMRLPVHPSMLVLVDHLLVGTRIPPPLWVLIYLSHSGIDIIYLFI